MDKLIMRIYLGSIIFLFGFGLSTNLQAQPQPDATEQDRFVRHPIDFTVNDLYEDDSGILWLGSWSGLIRYNPATGAQSRYSVSHGLPNAMVGQVIEDDDGFLWMLSPNDIVRFDPRTEAFQSVS